MKIENYVDQRRILGASGLFYAVGDFGAIDGDVAYTRTDEGEKQIYTYETETIRLVAEFLREGDVFVRRDCFENRSDRPLTIRALSSRFRMDGCNYEVYTQNNGWMHESTGEWQRLVTEVRAAAGGIRTCQSATPMLGLYNTVTEKNTVFHLIPNALWQMRARKVSNAEKDVVVVETGFSDTAFAMKAAPGEKIELPEVIFYKAKSRTDLDGYRLHAYFNRRYPRKKMPVLYNDWLHSYGVVDIDDLCRQADAAADIGCEAFMVDAGWYGDGSKNWFEAVGDWIENPKSGPAGRLAELSAHVRERGMIFGLWFEPERAGKESHAFASHPELFIKSVHGTFLDFSKPEAVDYIFETISGCIDRYHLGWLKFDFNDNLPTDVSGSAFYHYFKGQREFIRRLRERYPDLYITNCASGGYRMELSQSILFDSFWLSDDQEPVEGVRIVKDTIKRLPPALIERWCVQQYGDGFPVCGGAPVGKMLQCSNALWDYVVGVNDTFTEGFLTGGPMCFSCDVAGWPEDYKARYREIIATYKKERDFFMKASASLVADNAGITAIEYFDSDCKKLFLQVFTGNAFYSEDIRLSLHADATAKYRFKEECIEGLELCENGILITNMHKNCCQTFIFEKI
jgi:hypothetical protein